MKEMKVRLEFFEEVLGTASSDPEIHEKYIASNAPDAPSRKEEVEALGAEEVFEKSMTVFPRLDDGTPFLWDYQIKGFFKDSCGMLRKVKGTPSSAIKAYKKEIEEEENAQKDDARDRVMQMTFGGVNGEQQNVLGHTGNEEPE